VPHPRQNRVDPWGRLQADPRRSATRMGNRGRLHNERQEIFRHCDGKAWLCCSLKLNGIHRTIFQVEPRFSYSELFFLDEATALAAGHRPCSDCQPHRFLQFKRAWCAAHCPDKTPKQLLISEVDERLHSERLGPQETKLTFSAGLDTLPVGTMFVHAGAAVLVTSGGYFRWSFEGYTPETLYKVGSVDVLTPRSAVAALRAGYVPAIHASADA
jgi:hypothetical protein